MTITFAPAHREQPSDAAMPVSVLMSPAMVGLVEAAQLVESQDRIR